MKYTIETATPTGKVDPTYGSEYFVKFSEDERQVKMSRKKTPQVGGEENGAIVDGTYGAYFKKDPMVAPASSPAFAKQPFIPRKDNSDGQRQGMCINNAANFVNQFATKDLGSEDWARAVWDYARALYELGDLTEAPAEVPKNVQEVFGLKK